MKHYLDYFDLSFKNRRIVRAYEKEHSTKLYVAEEFSDLSGDLDSIKHSKFGLIDIIVPKTLKLSLTKIKGEDDIRNVSTKVLGIKIPNIDYKYPYFSAEFAEFPFQKFTRLGIGMHILDELLNKYGRDEIITIENSHFTHFTGQKYPELLHANFPFGNGKKRKEEKEERKLLNLLGELSHC